MVPLSLLPYGFLLASFITELFMVGYAEHACTSLVGAVYLFILMRFPLSVPGHMYAFALVAMASMVQGWVLSGVMLFWLITAVTLLACKSMLYSSWMVYSAIVVTVMGSFYMIF